MFTSDNYKKHGSYSYMLFTHPCIHGMDGRMLWPIYYSRDKPTYNNRIKPNGWVMKYWYSYKIISAICIVICISNVSGCPGAICRFSFFFKIWETRFRVLKGLHSVAKTDLIKWVPEKRLSQHENSYHVGSKQYTRRIIEKWFSGALLAPKI